MMTRTNDDQSGEARVMPGSAAIAAATPPAMAEAVKSMAESMGLSADERSRAAKALETYAQKAGADPKYAQDAAMIACQLREL